MLLLPLLLVLLMLDAANADSQSVR